MTSSFRRGTVFRHGRWLEPDKRTRDERISGSVAPSRERAICRVTAIRHGEVYYGFGADATKSSYHATAEYLLRNGAAIIEEQQPPATGRDRTAWPSEFKHDELCAWRFGASAECDCRKAQA